MRISIIAYTGNKPANVEEMKTWTRLETIRGDAAEMIVKQTATGSFEVQAISTRSGVPSAIGRVYNNLTDLLAESVRQGEVDVKIVTHGEVDGNGMDFVDAGGAPINRSTRVASASTLATMFEQALHDWRSRAASLPRVTAKIRFDSCYSAVATGTGAVSENSFVQRFSEDLSRQLRSSASGSSTATDTSRATANINLEVQGAGGAVMYNDVPNGFVATINSFYVEDRLKSEYLFTDFNEGTDGGIARDIVHEVNEYLYVDRVKYGLPSDPPAFTHSEIKDAWSAVTRRLALRNKVSSTTYRQLISFSFVKATIRAMEDEGLRDGWAVTRNLTGSTETVSWSPTNIVAIPHGAGTTPRPRARGRSGVAVDDQIAGDPDVGEMQSFAENSADCHAAIRADQELFAQTAASRLATLRPGATIEQDSVVYDDVAQLLRFKVRQDGVVGNESQPLPLGRLKTPGVMAVIAADFALARDDVGASGAGTGTNGVRGALSASMTMLSFIGAANALKRGDHANAALGLAGGSVGTLAAGKAAVDSHTAQALGRWLLKGAENSASATSASPLLAQALRGGSRLLEAGGNGLLTLSRAGASCLPVMGAAVQVGMIGMDTSDLVGGIRRGSPVAIAASCVNLALDGAIALADVVPGAGLAVSVPLSVARMAWQPLVHAARALMNSAGSALLAADSTPEGTILNGLASLTPPGIILNLYAAKRLGEQMGEQRSVLDDPMRHALDTYVVRSSQEIPDSGRVSGYQPGDIGKAGHPWATQLGRFCYYVSVDGGNYMVPPVDWRTGDEQSNEHWTFVGNTPPTSKYGQFDFSAGTNSYLAGYLDVWFDDDGKGARVHAGPDASNFGQTEVTSTPFQFPDSMPAANAAGYRATARTDVPAKSVIMGMGQSYLYKFGTAEPRILFVPIAHDNIATSVNVAASRESHYHAPKNADMAFIAPTHFPPSPSNPALSESLATRPSQFTYVMHGGSGRNSYLLGHEQAKIVCGRGSNEIVVPLAPPVTGTATINIVDIDQFRGSSDCALKLNNLLPSDVVSVSRSRDDLILECKGTRIILRGMAITPFNIELSTGVYQCTPTWPSSAASVNLRTLLNPVVLDFSADKRNYASPGADWFGGVASNPGGDVTVFDRATGNMHVGRRNPRSGQVEFKVQRLSGQVAGPVVSGGADDIELTCGPGNPGATLRAGTGHTTYLIGPADGNVKLDNRLTPSGMTNRVALPISWSHTNVRARGDSLVILDDAGKQICQLDQFFGNAQVGEAVRRIEFASSDGVVFAVTNTSPHTYVIKSVSNADALLKVQPSGGRRSSSNTLDMSALSEQTLQTNSSAGFGRLASDIAPTALIAGVGSVAGSATNLIAGKAGGLLKASTSAVVYTVPPGVPSVVIDNSSATTDGKSNLLDLKGVRMDELLVLTVIDPRASADNNRVIKLVKRTAPPSCEVELRPGSFRHLVVQSADGRRFSLEPGADGSFYPQELGAATGLERSLSPGATARAQSILPVDMTPIVWDSEQNATVQVLGDDGRPASTWPASPSGGLAVNVSSIEWAEVRRVSNRRVSLRNGGALNLPAGLAAPRFLVFKDGYLLTDTEGDQTFVKASSWSSPAP